LALKNFHGLPRTAEHNPNCLACGCGWCDSARQRFTSTHNGQSHDPMLIISSAIRRTRTPDGGILLDVERGRMFCLNPVASKILDLLDEGCDRAQIVDQLSAAYDADVEVVRVDVRDFLEALCRHRIVREDGPTSVADEEACHGATGAA